MAIRSCCHKKYFLSLLRGIILKPHSAASKTRRGLSVAVHPTHVSQTFCWNLFSSFHTGEVQIYSSEDVSGGLCCADLVVTVMTRWGARRRQTAQQTPTTLIIREQNCFGCSADGSVNHAVRVRTVQTNAVRQRVCLWIFQEFWAPGHDIRPHRQSVITLNVPLKGFAWLWREAAGTTLKPSWSVSLCRVYVFVSTPTTQRAHAFSLMSCSITWGLFQGSNLTRDNISCHNTPLDKVQRYFDGEARVLLPNRFMCLCGCLIGLQFS